MSDPFRFGGGPDTRWQRWTPGSFDRPEPQAQPAAAEEPDEPALPDPEQLRLEIEALREAARQQGHDEGYKAGYDKGLNEGHKQGVQQGEQQGFDAGLTTGHTAGMKRAETELEQLNAVVTQAAQSLQALESDIGQSLIQLAIGIAEQVLHTTLKMNPDVLNDLVRDILHTDRHNDVLVTLRVNPDDYELVNTYLQSDPSAGAWRLLADPALHRGDCLAESPLGTIDAALNTRWERVTAALGYPGPLKQP